MDPVRRQRGLKRSVEAVTVGVVLVGLVLAFLGLRPQKIQSSGCHIPAIYNFGDSNSDTGGLSAVFHQLPSPYGNTFFGKPSGRFSDGRLMIDFIAQKLGLPYLSAYLDSFGANFHHGVNFATGGSTIMPIDGRLFEGIFSPISLNIQFSQFVQLKSRVNEVLSQDKNSYVSATIPTPEDFSKALYTIDIGQNDIHAGLRWKTLEQVLESISDMTAKLALTIEQLYQQGSRIFWIHNTGPLGCLPLCLAHSQPGDSDLDQNGCLKTYNEVAQEFNRLLKERVLDLRAKLSDAVLIYIDIYTAKYTLISEAEKYGFSDPLGQCCGGQGDSPFHCGVNTTTSANGTQVFGGSCSNPSKYINWDSVHYTDAANEWIAKRVLDGSFSDPPVSITEVCRKPPQL
ncbi:GDSL esterase/lipase At5g14450-like [Argentina anserina]|uniref:GDSL esterase/lipase At5g14450-like n=1 Tax=Argentina anserina TaxID=57926 RepID=UPI0021762703|nr:GDSL esterase/lipase At5g14450-like [Potentilla anserina]